MVKTCECLTESEKRRIDERRWLAMESAIAYHLAAIKNLQKNLRYELELAESSGYWPGEAPADGGRT